MNVALDALFLVIIGQFATLPTIRLVFIYSLIYCLRVLQNPKWINLLTDGLKLLILSTIYLFTYQIIILENPVHEDLISLEINPK